MMHYGYNFSATGIAMKVNVRSGMEHAKRSGALWMD
jgi:hypothetical protein